MWAMLQPQMGHFWNDRPGGFTDCLWKAVQACRGWPPSIHGSKRRLAPGAPSSFI